MSDYPIGNCSFFVALPMLLDGVRMARGGWNGRKNLGPGQGMYVYYAERGSAITPDMSDSIKMAIAHSLGPMLIMYTPEGSHQVWCPSQTDILADDWFALG